MHSLRFFVIIRIMKTYICGHRNPDTDTVMSAYALAELRRFEGMENVEAICPGRLPAKSEWAFKHFNMPPIKVKRDVYTRVGDIVERGFPSIDASVSVLDALKLLDESGHSSLPVTNADGTYRGMLRPAKLLPLFIKRVDLSTIKLTDAPLHVCKGVLNENDRVRDIKSAAIKNSHNHFPVVNDEGRLVGTVLKKAFAEKPPTQMILVDHNEIDQSIPGADELPVIEVIDHHRMMFSSTKEPIKFMADVVGSTCTIVTRMYRAMGCIPSKGMAGLLISGIVSDTLLFQSPTTTKVDIMMCEWLEKICGESAKSIMEGLTSVDSALIAMPPEQALKSDLKFYKEGATKFALSQIEEVHLSQFHKRIDSLSAELDTLIRREALDFAALMVTDPNHGYSELLFRGKESVRRQLPYTKRDDGLFEMPGVLSRKKQLLPEIILAL